MHACTFYETIKRYRCLVSESVKGRNIIMWNNIHVKLYFDFEESPQMTIVVRSFVRYVTTHGTRSGWTSRQGQLDAIIIFTRLVDVRRRVHNTFMLNICTAYSHNQPNDAILMLISFFFIFSLDGINSSSFTFTRPFLCRTLLRSVLGLLLTCMLPLKCRPREMCFRWIIGLFIFFSNYFEAFVSF